MRKRRRELKRALREFVQLYNGGYTDVTTAALGLAE